MELLKNWISQAIAFSIILNLISESISTEREYKQRDGEWIISHKRNLSLSSRVYQSFFSLDLKNTSAFPYKATVYQEYESK